MVYTNCFSVKTQNHESCMGQAQYTKWSSSRQRANNFSICLSPALSALQWGWGTCYQRCSVTFSIWSKNKQITHTKNQTSSKMAFVQLLSKSCQTAQKDLGGEECKVRIAISSLCSTAGPETHTTLEVFQEGPPTLPGKIQNSISSVQWSKSQASLLKFQPSTLQEDKTTN